MGQVSIRIWLYRRSSYEFAICCHCDWRRIFVKGMRVVFSVDKLTTLRNEETHIVEWSNAQICLRKKIMNEARKRPRFTVNQRIDNHCTLLAELLGQKLNRAGWTPRQASINLQADYMKPEPTLLISWPLIQPVPHCAEHKLSETSLFAGVDSFHTWIFSTAVDGHLAIVACYPSAHYLWTTRRETVRRPTYYTSQTCETLPARRGFPSHNIAATFKIYTIGRPVHTIVSWSYFVGGFYWCCLKSSEFSILSS